MKTAGELMVDRDTRFSGLRVVSVYAEEDGALTFRFTATGADWFAPDDAEANANGWVSLDDFVGELRLEIEDDEERHHAAATLLRWRNTGSEIAGFASVERQLVGLVNPQSRMTSSACACRLTTLTASSRPALSMVT